MENKFYKRIKRVSQEKEALSTILDINKYFPYNRPKHDTVHNEMALSPYPKENFEGIDCASGWFESRCFSAYTKDDGGGAPKVFIQ